MQKSAMDRRLSMREVADVVLREAGDGAPAAEPTA
jgi:AmiR/NasT family two-component response regulator